MSGKRPSIPLTGGDYFALALDHTMRRAGMAGSICRLVVELGGRLEAKRLRAALDASGLEPWLANVRFSRALPFLKPRWRQRRGGGSLPIAERAAADAPPAPDERSNLAFDLVHQPDGKTALILTWHHGLMDARGAELLLHHIDASAAGKPPSPETVFGNVAPTLREQLRDWLRAPARLRLSRQSLTLVDAASRPPLVSLTPNGRRGHRELARGRASGARGASSRFRTLSFTLEETARIAAVGDRAGAGFRRSLFCLAAAVRALDAVRARRGAETATWLVPVPQDRRRRGALGPIFSNQVSFLFYRGEPDDLASIETLVASLRRQMTEQVRDRIPDYFALAMEMFQRVPLGWYARILRGPSGGQFASLFFSDTGESFCGRTSFLGAPIVGIAHLPPVPVPPGVAVVCSTFQGRLGIVLSWVEGCLAADEVDLVERTLRSELLADGVGDTV